MASKVFVHRPDPDTGFWVQEERCFSRVPAVGEIVFPGSSPEKAGKLGPHKVIQVDWFVYRAPIGSEFDPAYAPEDAEIWLEPVDQDAIPRVLDRPDSPPTVIPEVLLAETIHEQDDATLLLIRAGFPKAKIPAFKDAQTFWAKSLEEARKGVLPGGEGPILKQAAEMYPYNKELVELARARSL